MSEKNKTESRRLRPHLEPPGRESAGKKTSGWELMLAGDFNDKQDDLLQSLIEVPRHSRGTIYFDSSGGSVYTSLSLMSLIRLRGLQVTGIVLGECSSAALLPFAACQRRQVLPFSTHLFHPMKWESEENVKLKEAAEWARHFEQIDQHFDQLLANLFGADPAMLAEWSEPGRFVSGSELAQAGLAELINPFSDSDQPKRITNTDLSN